MASLLRGWALAEQGDVEQGIADIEQGLALKTTMETGLGRSAHYAHLAAAKARAGRFTEARELIERSKALVTATGERYHEPEIHRIDAELVLAEAGGAGGAPSEPRANERKLCSIPPSTAPAAKEPAPGAARHDGARSPLRARRERHAGARPAGRAARLLHRGLRHRRFAGGGGEESSGLTTTDHTCPRSSSPQLTPHPNDRPSSRSPQRTRGDHRRDRTARTKRGASLMALVTCPSAPKATPHAKTGNRLGGGRPIEEGDRRSEDGLIDAGATVSTAWSARIHDRLQLDDGRQSPIAMACEAAGARRAIAARSVVERPEEVREHRAVRTPGFPCTLFASSIAWHFRSVPHSFSFFARPTGVVSPASGCTTDRWVRPRRRCTATTAVHESARESGKVPIRARKRCRPPSSDPSCSAERSDQHRFSTSTSDQRPKAGRGRRYTRRQAVTRASVLRRSIRMAPWPGPAVRAPSSRPTARSTDGPLRSPAGSSASPQTLTGGIPGVDSVTTNKRHGRPHPSSALGRTSPNEIVIGGKMHRLSTIVLIVTLWAVSASAAPPLAPRPAPHTLDRLTRADLLEGRKEPTAR